MSDSRVRQHRTKASYLTERFQYRFIYSTFFEIDSGTLDDILDHLLIDDTDVGVGHGCEVVARVVDEEEEYELIRRNSRLQVVTVLFLAHCCLHYKSSYGKVGTRFDSR